MSFTDVISALLKKKKKKGKVSQKSLVQMLLCKTGKQLAGFGH